MRKAAIGIVFATFGARAAAAETVTLRAYAPPTDKEISYRVQVTTSGSLGDKEARIHGDFRNALTVTSRTARGFRAIWRIDATDPAAPSPDGAYAVNDHCRGTTALYGITSVALETDPTGAPLRIDDRGAIRRNMETTIRTALGSAPVPPGTVLDTLLRKIEADPMFPAHALVPALALVTRMQAPQDTDFEIGKVHARDDEARAFGEMIEGEIEAARRRNGIISAQQMSELTAASARQNGLARLSLDDGATVYAEENIATRMGPLRSGTTVRVTRE